MRALLLFQTCLEGVDVHILYLLAELYNIAKNRNDKLLSPIVDLYEELRKTDLFDEIA